MMFQRDIAQIIAAMVAQEQGHISQTLSLESQNKSPPQKVTKLNPYHRPYVYHVLCADWLLKKEYERAYLETLNFRLPSLFWDPMWQASSLGLLGRNDEGNRYVEDLLKIIPNFPDRGRTLIKYWGKTDELFECIIDGLKKSGLEIK